MKRLAVALCAALAAGYAGAQSASPPPCPPEGDATGAKQKALNSRMARADAPTDGELDDTVSMEALTEPGDDRLRWQDGTAVEIVAFVLSVRDGGMASSNCHAAAASDQDTVLELSPSANIFDNAHRVVAAVSPAWRRIMAGNHVDWSTRALRAKYLQKTVVVSGWLLFNPAAAATANNTASEPGVDVQRATAWEIHPVTALELYEEGDSLQARASGNAPLARPSPPGGEEGGE